MAGIFERLKPSAVDRVSAHLLDAAFVFNATGDFTTTQLKNGINGTLASPLAGAELTDIDNIATQLAAQANNTLKIIYFEKVKAATICVEMGVMNEATFRSVLGIA
jgi:hypothetical protein